MEQQQVNEIMGVLQQLPPEVVAVLVELIIKAPEVIDALMQVPPEVLQQILSEIMREAGGGGNTQPGGNIQPQPEPQPMYE